MLPGITSGIILGFSGVIFAISFGSLIFSGELANSLPRGIGIVLFTVAILMIVTSLFSRIPGVISSAQDTSSVMLAVIAAGLVKALPGINPQERLVTVLAALSIATLLTGIFFIVLGSFKLGGFVRYTPYPVVGGFLAGSGWLLIQGAMGVMAHSPLHLANLGTLLQADQMIIWIPGVIFAVLMYFGLRASKHVLALPGILLGGVVIFYLLIFMMSISIPEARNKGLLIGLLSDKEVWRPLLPSDLASINWAAVMGQIGNIGIVLVLSLVGFMLNVSALELAIHRDIDFNRELQAAGAANILAGLGGGLAGYHALSLSTLSYRIGGRGRLPGLVAGLVCLVMLITGTGILAYIPIPILGGLLFYLGLDFLSEWAILGWKKLSHADYGIVLLILAIIATTNFLIGVAAGLVASIILFVVNYSRINVIYHSFSGADIHSNVERCTYHRRALEEMGGRIYILELQGFLFFGTANHVLEQIRRRLADAQLAHVRYLILDFRRVSGVDTSAGLSFAKGKQLAEAQGVILVLTHISSTIQHQLGIDNQDDERILVLPDLDHGLEWCEEQLLEMNQVTGLHTPVALVAQLADSGFEKANTTQLRGYLERVVFKAGDYLVHQGEIADSLYFIELGLASVYLDTEEGERLRLQTYGLGTAVGEMDLVQGAKCTASVVADSPVIAYRLTLQKLTEMKTKDPELTIAFHEFIAHLLSERLAATTRIVESLLR